MLRALVDALVSAVTRRVAGVVGAVAIVPVLWWLWQRSRVRREREAARAEIIRARLSAAQREAEQTGRMQALEHVRGDYLVAMRRRDEARRDAAERRVKLAQAEQRVEDAWTPRELLARLREVD